MMLSHLMTRVSALCFIIVGIIPAFKADHLCKKLNDGQLSSIHIKSISYFSPEYLLLFESGEIYRIQISELKSNSQRLPIPKGYSLWNHKNLMSDTSSFLLLFKSPIRNPLWAAAKKSGITALNPPESLYLLSLGDIGELNKNDDSLGKFHPETGKLLTNAGKRTIFSMVTKKREFVFDITGEKGRNNPTVLRNSSREHPGFALITQQRLFEVHNEQDSLTWPEGYVVHKDIYNNTKQFIIYDLQIQPKSSELPISTLSNPVPVIQPYFYLQLTENSDELRLLPSNRMEGNLGQPERSLFKALPLGYRYGKNTYLFDQERYCVYIIELKGQLKHQKDALILPRKNVPYESFFDCDTKEFPKKYLDYETYPENRCDTLFYPNGPSKEPQPGQSDDSLHKKWNIKLIILVLSVILVVLGLFLIFMFWNTVFTKDMRKKVAKKMSWKFDREKWKKNRKSRMTLQRAKAHGRFPDPLPMASLTSNTTNSSTTYESKTPPPPRKATPRRGSPKNSPRVRTENSFSTSGSSVQSTSQASNTAVPAGKKFDANSMPFKGNPFSNDSSISSQAESHNLAKKSKQVSQTMSKFM